MAAVKYIAVKQGGKHFIDENEMEYRRIKTRANKIYYQCIEKNNTLCPAGAVICSKSDVLIKLLGEHNHDSNLLRRKVRSLEYEAVQQAAGNIASPRSILGNLTNKVAGEMDVGIGSMKTKL